MSAPKCMKCDAFIWESHEAAHLRGLCDDCDSAEIDLASLVDGQGRKSVTVDLGTDIEPDKEQLWQL